MKAKILSLLLLQLICCHFEIFAQTTSTELLKITNFGTTGDGVTGINRRQTPLSGSTDTPCPNCSTLYPGIGTTATANTIKANYFQPPTRVYYNNTLTSISINPAVTVAPPLIYWSGTGTAPAGWQTQYIFGFNETWYSNRYQFITDPNAATPQNSGIQIPMAPNNGRYVIATSTQGMYNAPTLAAGSAAWHVVYDRYEVDQAHPSNYFLIVNADPTASKIFYQQSVTVAPGHIYRMSADLARLNTGNDPGSAPNVAFKINNASVYNTGAITTGGTWKTHTFDYVAPCGTTNSTITFSNNSLDRHQRKRFGIG